MTDMPELRGVGGFLRGVGYALRGFAYLAGHRATWPYALAPAAVYVVILLLLGAAGVLVLDDVYHWMQPAWLERPATPAGWWVNLWHSLLNILLAVAVFLMMTAGTILGTLLVAAVLAGPFNEKLSEVVELLATGRQPADEPLRLSVLTRDSVRAVMAALQLLGLFLVLYIPLLLFSLLPVIGVLGVIGTFLYSCFFLALNFLDPALDRHRLSLREKLRWIRSIWAVHMGFGTALFGFMLVPVLNLMVAPCFVAGGTLLWVELGGKKP